MRFVLAAGFSLVALSACDRARITGWDKPGIDQAAFDADSDNCTRKMNKAATPATMGGGLIGALADSSDRYNVYESCMVGLGYTRRPGSWRF
jgi:hypothetical protein